MVEQRTENPRVGGSNPPPGTIISKEKAKNRLSDYKIISLTKFHSYCVIDEYVEIVPNSRFIT